MSSRTGHEKGRRTSQSKTGHFKRSGKPNRVEDQTTRRHPTRTAKAKAKAKANKPRVDLQNRKVIT